MTQVRARMRKEKLFSQIKRNETVKVYFIYLFVNIAFCRMTCCQRYLLQHKIFDDIVLSYVNYTEKEETNEIQLFAVQINLL